MAAVLAAVLVELLAGRGGADDGAQGVVATSTSPTGFVLPRLGGPGVLRLSDFRGRPVVVDFYASWCTACDGELPGFARVAPLLANRVRFIAVDSMETGDGLAFARGHGVGAWPLARDVDGVQNSGLHDSLGGRGMPITAFYSEDGRVLEVSPGALTEQELADTLQRLYGITVATP